MEISLSAPSQLTNQGSLSNAVTKVAGVIAASNESAQPVVSSTPQIQPAPVIRVNEQNSIESPFIEITQEASDNRLTANTAPTSVSPPDTSRTQIRELTLEQSNIQDRQNSLESEQREIQQDIDELQRRELEINRKKFELQRQTSLGNIINISI